MIAYLNKSVGINSSPVGYLLPNPKLFSAMNRTIRPIQIANILKRVTIAQLGQLVFIPLKCNARHQSFHVLSQNDDDNNVYNGLYQRNNPVQLLDFIFSYLGPD